MDMTTGRQQARTIPLGELVGTCPLCGFDCPERDLITTTAGEVACQACLRDATDDVADVAPSKATNPGHPARD